MLFAGSSKNWSVFACAAHLCSSFHVLTWKGKSPGNEVGSKIRKLLNEITCLVTKDYAATKLDTCSKTTLLIPNSTVPGNRSKMKAALFLVAFLLSVATVFSKKISYSKCTAPNTSPVYGEISNFDVSPCDEEPCVLKKGSNLTLTINFIPHEAVSAAKIYAWVFFRFFPVHFPVKSPDACTGHGLTCPLKSGVAVEFVNKILISEDLPSGKLKMDMGLKDQDDKSIICAKVSLKIAWKIMTLVNSFWTIDFWRTTQLTVKLNLFATFYFEIFGIPL